MHKCSPEHFLKGTAGLKKDKETEEEDKQKVKLNTELWTKVEEVKWTHTKKEVTTTYARAYRDTSGLLRQLGPTVPIMVSTLGSSG